MVFETGRVYITLGLRSFGEVIGDDYMRKKFIGASWSAQLVKHLGPYPPKDDTIPKMRISVGLPGTDSDSKPFGIQ